MKADCTKADGMKEAVSLESRQASEMPALRETLTKGLNEAQIQAVTHGEGPALVLAGPGSGKTTVIVRRILYLIKVQKIPPEEILVVTFTKEAALSMQNRFMEQEVYPVNFGTFHSIFYHILIRSHYPAVSKIMTQAQKQDIMWEILKKKAISQGGHYEYEGLKEQVENCLAAIGFYKNTRDRQKTGRLLGPECRADFDVIFQMYQERCRQQGGIDFDDMVYECRELLLSDETVREYWQKRFRYILVDEFQDINPIQYETLKLLGERYRNLFAVGDEDQAIYAFRGSSPECVKRFIQEYQAREILLNANYRSTAEIVAAAELVIRENKSRILKNKASYAAGANAGLARSIRLKSFESKDQEMDYLTERLREFYCPNGQTQAAEHAAEEAAGSGQPMKGDGQHTGEMRTCGVLFRTNNAMQGLAVRLAKAEIPFVMKEKGGNIYEHFIVKDIMAYLKLAAGENSRRDFLRIMNKPSRYISRECVGETERIDLDRIHSTNANAETGIRRLKSQLERMRGMSLPLAVRYISKVIGYETYLKQQQEAGKHLEEWMEILDFCGTDCVNYESVAEWERAQKALEKQLKERKTPRSATDQGIPVIHLMTVHASKGLEFDRVYLPDCNEKTYPHGSMPDPETVEEERRIFYVAMTRAKKDLELLGITGTKERPRLFSRFLNPIIHQLTRQTHSCPDIHQKRP